MFKLKTIRSKIAVTILIVLLFIIGFVLRKNDLIAMFVIVSGCIVMLIETWKDR